MKTYIIEKTIKCHSVIEHFENLSWVLKARSKDKASPNLSYLHIQSEFICCTDGSRLHTYKPDYSQLPDGFELPCGNYQVVTINAKQIIIQSIDDDIIYPDVLRVIPSKDNLKADLDTIDISLFIYHIITITKCAFDIAYLQDGFIGNCTLYYNGGLNCSMIENGKRMALLMPIRVS